MYFFENTDIDIAIFCKISYRYHIKTVILISKMSVLLWPSNTL